MSNFLPTSPDETIPVAVPELMVERASRYLSECLETGYVSSVGPFVTRFERELAAAVGTGHAVACNTGTAALHLALVSTGVGSGDEVLVSDFAYIAAVNPITYVGATPVLVDADEATWNISTSLVAGELERRARLGQQMPGAVLAVHILGLPAELAPLIEVCERYGVILIEDAAEALGASYAVKPLAERQVGTVGRIGCYSFNGNKIITAGGGGMLVTDDESLAQRARHLSTQARVPGPEYVHDEVGFNYRLTNIAAALGVAQLEELDPFIEKKRSIAARYDEALEGIPGVTFPPRPPWAKPTMWLYSILIDPSVACCDRKSLAHRLAHRGIMTAPLFTPIHRMAPYRDMPRLGGDVGERLHHQGLSLPCSVSLSEDDQEKVIAAIYEELGGA